jgi:2-phospho-L-lactate/phosphoenolpyruvate guanylyltransferase
VSTQILIPLKHLDDAKQRLRPALGDDERRRLMLAMVEHVAREALAADAGPVALASSEPRAPALAEAFGIRHVTDGGLPWNEGLTHARDQLPEPLELVVYLAGDLPLVQAKDIRALLVATPPAGVAIARAHDGGTNALAVRPADALTPSFGAAASAAVHAERAAQAGLDAVTVDRPGLALDVDTPDDVIRARLSLTA